MAVQTLCFQPVCQFVRAFIEGAFAVDFCRVTCIIVNDFEYKNK